MSSNKHHDLHFESQLIHPPGDGDDIYGDVVVPIHLTTTYAQPAFAQPPRYDYSRGGNPTRQVVEDQIARLEGGCGGLAFATGMAAITAVLSLFEPGDELLIPNNIYGGTFRVLSRYFERFGLKHRFVDVADLAAVEAAFGAVSPSPKAIVFESPTNPLLAVADIAAVSDIAHGHQALAIVDNTFLSPYLQRPLELGADVSLHSATKFLGGHSDVLAGLVAVRDEALFHKLHFIQYSTGGTLSAFDSYLLSRGIKTLAVRLDRQVANAQRIAEWLEEQPQVSRVYYPGLPSHPGYEVHKRQAAGAGSLLSLELAPGRDPQRFAQALRLVTLAESLGAVESLICHPATMTHASIPAPLRAEMGINERLLRLSIGIEHPDDLLADLEQALAAI
ncbi:MAG: PLP-dependent aspartate aminotransferase family protein [Coriobacteriales bacterium]|jgi:cystathionine beta-lyase/cystathionine gamma-synthase|nr:PLP-dependent aspartate aminotransferase family protein [Coriobacteriales bacterium]